MPKFAVRLKCQDCGGPARIVTNEPWIIRTEQVMDVWGIGDAPHIGIVWEDSPCQTNSTTAAS